LSHDTRLNLSKKGIRCLGIAESFDEDRYFKSVFAGVVMRKDLVIDGAGFSTATLGGDDATDAILDIYRGLHRTDINVITVSGAIVSLYNIIDPEKIYSETGVPVILLTYRSTHGIELSIKKKFGPKAGAKIEAYRRLGPREKITLRTGKHVYIRRVGIGVREATQLLNQFTLQGRYPEPVRVARILARALLESLTSLLRQQQPDRLWEQPP